MKHVKDIIDKIDNYIKRKDSLEKELVSLLEDEELVVSLSYHVRSDFTSIHLNVTKEALVAAITREIEVAKKTIQDLAKQAGEELGF